MFKESDAWRCKCDDWFDREKDFRDDFRDDRKDDREDFRDERKDDRWDDFRKDDRRDDCRRCGHRECWECRCRRCCPLFRK